MTLLRILLGVIAIGLVDTASTFFFGEEADRRSYWTGFIAASLAFAIQLYFI